MREAGDLAGGDLKARLKRAVIGTPDRPSGRRGRRWAAGVGLGALLGFLVLNVLAFNHARALTRFRTEGGRTPPTMVMSPATLVRVLVRGVDLPRPATRRTPADVAPDCRETTIAVGDGVELSAWYCDRGSTTPLVVIFHAYGGEKSAMVREAAAFLGMGASVLLVDFRGSGGSTESYTTVGVHEAADVAAVMAHTRSALAHTRVVLFGQSMGAAAILRAVARHDVRSDAVIIESVFDTMLNTVRNRFALVGLPAFPAAHLVVFWGGAQWGFNAFDHSPAADAASLRCPGLFMHGTNDPLATLAEGRRVFAAAAGPKEFVEFPSTGHQAYLAARPDLWLPAVERFMAQLRAGRPSSEF